MRRVIERVDRFVAARPRAIIAVWVVVLVAAVPFALRQDEGLTGGGFAVSGSESAQVEDLLARGAPADQRGVVLGAVIVRQRGATVEDVDAAVSDLRRAAASTPGVTMPRTSREIALSAARGSPSQPVLVPLVTSASEYRVPDVARELRDRLGIGDGYERHSVRMHLVGQGALWAGLLDLTKNDLKRAEIAGFPLVALILLAVFGSIAAALLPLAVAGLAVAITGALILALSGLTTMNVYASNMAAMIGIGVAVDYSLFVVVRYREELARGVDRAVARSRAMATSGVAVTFSGLAVIAALASLFVVQTAVLRSMALAAIVIVAVSVMLALALLPALLLVAGRWIGPRHVEGAGWWRAWADRVMGRPWVAVGVSSAVLLALAAPALGLKLGDGALRQFPAGNETRQGFDAALEQVPAGRGSPVKVLAAPEDVAATLQILTADREVRRAGTRVRTRDGRVIIIAEPKHDGDSPQAKAMVRRVRAQAPPEVLVGGNSAAQIDFDGEVLGSLWLVALITALLTFGILAALLRSVVLPVKAIVTNLLSVAAAFGVLTMVFVHGTFDSLLGFDSPGYVDTFTVPLIVAAVFGLSMDYEVFLLSRIRERFLATGDTRRAVGDALVSSARTITGAAAIMVAVFGVFIATGVPVIQQVGLGCAVAILIDATLVRLVLVPAAMTVLGKWNWWWPSRRGAAAVAGTVLVALGLSACGGSDSDGDRSSTTAENRGGREASGPVRVASARIRVTPPKAGTAASPVGVTVAADLRFRTQDGVEPPAVDTATIEFPEGTRFDGAAVPSCPLDRLRTGDPSVCPRGAITGSGTVAGVADTSPARGEITVVNGGGSRVWLYVVLRNPVRQESLVRGTVTRLSNGRTRLALRFPRDLQTVSGVPIGVRSLRLSAGREDWLSTTACPSGGRWNYRGEATFADGSRASYADDVACG